MVCRQLGGGSVLLSACQDIKKLSDSLIQWWGALVSEVHLELRDISKSDSDASDAVRCSGCVPPWYGAH